MDQILLIIKVIYFFIFIFIFKLFLFFNFIFIFYFYFIFLVVFDQNMLNSVEVDNLIFVEKITLGAQWDVRRADSCVIAGPFKIFYFFLLFFIYFFIFFILLFFSNNRECRSFDWHQGISHSFEEGNWERKCLQHQHSRKRFADEDAHKFDKTL